MEFLLSIDPPADLETNMAKDRALFENLKKGKGQPALRIYQWSQTCITVGFGIPMNSLGLAEMGLPMTKRPTGGGVVIHQPAVEITIVLAHYRKPGSILELYRKIHEPILGALLQLGVPATMLMNCPKSCGNAASPSFCFDAPVLYDLVSGPKPPLRGASGDAGPPEAGPRQKVLGGGMRVAGNVFLYQGTLKWPNLHAKTVGQTIANDPLFNQVWGIPIINEKNGLDSGRSLPRTRIRGRNDETGKSLEWEVV